MPGRSSAPVSIDAAPSGEHTVSDAPCSLRMTLWTVLYLANVIDVAFSCYAFSRGCGELNPVIELVWDKWGVSGLTLLKSIFLFVLLVLLPYVGGWKLKLLILCCSMYACLAIYHVALFLRVFP